MVAAAPPCRCRCRSGPARRSRRGRTGQPGTSASLVLVPDHSSWSERVEIEAVSPAESVSTLRCDRRPGVYGLLAGRARVSARVQRERRPGDPPPQRRPRLSRARHRRRDRQQRLLRRPTGSPGPSLPRRSHPQRARTDAGLGDPGGIEQARRHRPSSAWAIVVHGINGDRQIGLRIAPTLHRAGFNSLLISYRDDLGAPEQPRRPPPPGTDRVADLEAAVRYALHHGARRLVLDRLLDGRRADRPVHGALTARRPDRRPGPRRPGTRLEGDPRIQRRTDGPARLPALPVEWAIDARTDVDWDSLDALQHPEDFHLPILLFHGDDDQVVPIATSEDFADELPRWVTYYPAPKAGHTQSWNVDPRPLRPAPAGVFSCKSAPKAESSPTGWVGLELKKNRRRPTLPGGCPPSTIGAERLNCSVRNGKRCFPFAMRHRKFARQPPRWSLKTAQGRNGK